MTCFPPIRKCILVGRHSKYNKLLLYRWCFSHYSLLIHWLYFYGYMTSNNETVYCQMPLVGNIAKTMMSNGIQLTATHIMLTTVARDQSEQLKMA